MQSNRAHRVSTLRKTALCARGRTTATIDGCPRCPTGPALLTFSVSFLEEPRHLRTRRNVMSHMLIAAASEAEPPSGLAGWAVDVRDALGGPGAALVGGADN